MNVTTNELIEYFATSSIQFMNVFIITLPARKMDTNRKTDHQICGLFIPLKGQARFSLNGIPYKVNTNTIIHASSSMDIEIKTFDEDFTYVVVQYKIVQAQEAFKQLLHKHFSITVDDMTAIMASVQQLLSKNVHPDYFSRFELQVIFMNLIQAILNGARNNQYDGMLHVITKVLEYFHTHYEEEILISEIADMFEVDRRRIAYLFEKVTGLTPIQYLTKYRISKAKELLALSELSILEVSEAVGYQDSFYFSRVFKKLMHLSPSEYRKNVQNQSIFHYGV
ncbi:AraC family transcriptional regulator [Lysinibacillus sp. KU-BSD001]|uniref:helix-turn-helix domain-containing protein n=1 Tax=Lysinibacillus sp. KU-BSD001 TaxID=3141328 RepID=UPI0036E4C00F